MQINPLAFFVILCSALLAGHAFYAWRHRFTASTMTFTHLIGALALYTFGYGMELASLDLSHMLFWSKVQYVGIVNIAPLWVIFALQYAGREKWLRPWTRIILFAIPAVTLAITFTNSLHHLHYRTVAVYTGGPVPLLAFTRGIWYWVNAAYINLGIIAGLILLWGKRLHSPALYRRQTTLVIIGSAIPLAVSMTYVLELSPVKHLDLNPFGFTVSVVCMSVGMFRHRMFALTPIAREALIENLRDGVVVLDAQNRVVDHNGAAQRIFGWTQSPLGCTASQVCESWPELADQCSDGKPVSAEIQLDWGKEAAFCEVHISVLHDGRGNGVGKLVVAHDITKRRTIEQELQKAKNAAEAATEELRKAWAKLEKSAITDALTGAYNRRKFGELIVGEINRARRYRAPLSLLMLDIDHFKLANDRFGHHMGDSILIEITRVIGANTRAADALFRWGGEEFILLTPGITLEQAMLVAEKLRARIAAHFFSVLESVTISVGLTQYREGDNPDSLVKRADDALYRAKEKGRNRIEVEVADR